MNGIASNIVTGVVASVVTLGGMMILNPHARCARPVPAPRSEGSALEAEFAALKAEQTQTRAALQGLSDLKRQLEPVLHMMTAEAGPKDGAPAARTPRQPLPSGVQGPGGIAELLSLDSPRRAAFEEAHERLMERIRTLEAARARVSADANKTQIEIPAFPDEMKSLVKEWNQQLGTLLTPDERKKYDTFGMESALLPRSGDYDRTIIMRRSEQTVNIQESGSAGGGQYSRSSSGPDNETTLAPYRHLLQR